MLLRKAFSKGFVRKHAANLNNMEKRGILNDSFIFWNDEPVKDLNNACGEN